MHIFALTGYYRKSDADVFQLEHAFSSFPADGSARSSAFNLDELALYTGTAS